MKEEKEEECVGVGGVRRLVRKVLKKQKSKKAKEWEWEWYYKQEGE